MFKDIFSILSIHLSTLHTLELVLNAKQSLLRKPFKSLSQWLGLGGTTSGFRHQTTLAYFQSQLLMICVGLPTAGERNCS